MYPFCSRYTFYVQTLLSRPATPLSIKKCAGWVHLLGRLRAWTPSPQFSPCMLSLKGCKLQNYLSPFPCLSDHMASVLLSLFHLEENYEVKLSRDRSASDQPLEIFYSKACPIIVFLNNRKFAFYELFLLKDFLCCLNTTFVNRFTQPLLLNKIDLISALFTCLCTMGFYDCNEDAQVKFFFLTQYYIQIF